MRVYGIGVMIKMMNINQEAHGLFKSVPDLALISGIYKYKFIKECQSIIRILEPKKVTKVSMENTREIKVSDLVDLI